jgi:hypothetical protein
MKITAAKIKMWDLSLLKRIRRLGMRVFSVDELNIVNKEIKSRQKKKKKPVSSIWGSGSLWV